MSQDGESLKGRRKIPARKKQRAEDALTPMVTFFHVEDKRRFAELAGKPFERISCIDWNTLRQLGIENEVMGLVSFGGWDRFFHIQDPTHRELTWEVLSTFQLAGNSTDMDDPDTINFRVGGQYYNMSYAQFSVHMGIYNEEFVTSPDYALLARNFPRGFSTAAYWSALTHRGHYNPSRAKSSQLESPALRYVHRLVACTVHARKDSPGVVGA